MHSFYLKLGDWKMSQRKERHKEDNVLSHWFSRFKIWGRDRISKWRREGVAYEGGKTQQQIKKMNSSEKLSIGGSDQLCQTLLICKIIRGLKFTIANSTCMSLDILTKAYLAVWRSENLLGAGLKYIKDLEKEGDRGYTVPFSPSISLQILIQNEVGQPGQQNQ